MPADLAPIEELFERLPYRRLHARFKGVEGEILRATFESILQVGIGATSTYEIAARAGTYQGRLRHYFPERDMIFERLLELMYGTYEQQLADIAGSGHAPETRFALIIESGLRWITEATDEFVVFVAYWSHAMAVGGALLQRCRELTDHFVATMAAAVSEGQRDGVFKDDMESQVVAQECLGLLWGLGLQYAMDPDFTKLKGMRAFLGRMVETISK